MEELRPVFTVDLFQELHENLIKLLRGLRADDWQKPTVTGRWRVRDVVAHLLDGDLRVLSLRRDGVQLVPEKPITGYESLLGFLDQLNADWIRAANRLSPRVMLDLLALTGPQVADYFAWLEPYELARFSVAWAGEEVSENWFDIGREYTERWHHQQQIRDAVAAPLLMEPKWLRPVIQISIRALPFVYREIGSQGDQFSIEILGKSGGTWTMRRELAGWTIYSGSVDGPTVTVDENDAWKYFFKWPVSGAGAQGDEKYAAPFKRALAVMA